ncbi:hypothetical protein [Tumebacillus lipolyticus]|uniref:Uncharacterized protein n=1 Tax=Tumebacillus lipolyticus TaxID=1280370 RepID=A0ABW4ZX60_9BACL
MKETLEQMRGSLNSGKSEQKQRVTAIGDDFRDEAGRIVYVTYSSRTPIRDLQYLEEHRIIEQPVNMFQN